MSGRADDREPREAQETAVAALAFLAADAERLGRFLALTGLDPAAIRAAAREREFLAGVLDHIAGDEALLLAFCAQAGFRPEAVKRACEGLAGKRWEREHP
jgi:hypothetical protein